MLIIKIICVYFYCESDEFKKYGDEGYWLNVDIQISIRAATTSGLFWGQEDETYWDLSIRRDFPFEPVQLHETDPLNPWGNPSIALRGKMVNSENNEKEVTLLPHGSSHLRRLTFPEAGTSAKPE